MDKIEVAILHEAHSNPAGMMMFLAKLTQRGHKINNMNDLMTLYNSTLANTGAASTIREVARLPHGTIKRFAPITIAIVGASRRFLGQARTHQVGLDYVSASLQYSDYSGNARFVVPYELMELDAKSNPDSWIKGFMSCSYVQAYLDSCSNSMQDYENLIKAGVSNDVAGYAAPQGLRNILIMQGNHQSWDYFIRLRSCNRNTVETQYVTMLIEDALRNSFDGEDLFAYTGPDCVYGACREGKMSCGNPLPKVDINSLMRQKWPLLFKE